MNPSTDWRRIVKALELTPHPEGGFYRETFRDVPSGAAGPCVVASSGSTQLAASRGYSTAIYFLLPKDVVSRWHRVDAAEVWHWYAGAPLELSEAPDGHVPDLTRICRHVLGVNLDAGERPQHVIPANAWQQALSLGGWTLVGCTVAPGFEFSGFEMMPKDGGPAAKSSPDA